MGGRACECVPPKAETIEVQSAGGGGDSEMFDTPSGVLDFGARSARLCVIFRLEEIAAGSAHVRLLATGQETMSKPIFPQRGE